MASSSGVRQTAAMTTALAPPPTSGASTRDRRPVVVGPVIAVAIVATVVWRVIDHRSEPLQVFGPVVGGFGFAADPVPLSESTMQIGFMAPYEGQEDPETLTFRSAEAHFRRNTADAVATISVCLPRTSPTTDLGGGGVVHAATLEGFCRKVQPVVPGTTLHWGTESMEGEFLVLTVRPTRPGVARIDSFTFDYTRDDAHGGQSGVEHVDDQEFVVRAS
ncbi:hypothetical protein BH09ACT12_BH09ACT12_29060 [soil metagenome]